MDGSRSAPPRLAETPLGRRRTLWGIWLKGRDGVDAGLKRELEAKVYEGVRLTRADGRGLGVVLTGGTSEAGRRYGVGARDPSPAHLNGAPIGHSCLSSSSVSTRRPSGSSAEPTRESNDVPCGLSSPTTEEPR